MPLSFTYSPFQFQIETEIRCAFPAYLHPELAAAAKAALVGLPRTIRQKKLRAGIPYRLTISVVSPQTIRKLNRDYRGKDRPTDVLSFSRLEGMPTPQPDIGDVLICWEVAKKQTKEFKTTCPGEIRRLVVHGILHLFGFDHEQNQRDSRKMFRLQERILKTLTPESLQ